jgi:hypothetical protein
MVPEAATVPASIPPVPLPPEPVPPVPPVPEVVVLEIAVLEDVALEVAVLEVVVLEVVVFEVVVFELVALEVVEPALEEVDPPPECEEVEVDVLPPEQATTKETSISPRWRVRRSIGGCYLPPPVVCSTCEP